MSGPTRACGHCGGALDQPLPADLLDPRLGAERVMRCSRCGRVERIDEPPREPSASRAGGARE